MLILLVPAAAFTLATLLLAALWWTLRRVTKGPQPGFWRRALLWHLGLFAFHLFVTVPLGLGILGSRWVGTRGDERGYRGPRLAADGAWQVQTRDSISAEPASEGLEKHFAASDGVKLRGFLVPAPGGKDATPRFQALLVHGLYRSALEIETPGAMLRELGGEVLLLELRNHGGSGHARPTFGRDEAEDVLAGVALLRARAAERAAPVPPLVLYAVSLGSAAAALAAPRVAGSTGLAGLILDAPLDDLAPTAARMLSGDGQRRASGFPQPWRSIMLWSARHLGGVPFDEVRPSEVLARLPPNLPVLLIGAGHDVRMPPETVRALFDRLPEPAGTKDLWIVPEAEHGKVWVARPEEYRARLSAFVDRAAPR